MANFAGCICVSGGHFQSLCRFFKIGIFSFTLIVEHSPMKETFFVEGGNRTLVDAVVSSIVSRRIKRWSPIDYSLFLYASIIYQFLWA